MPWVRDIVFKRKPDGKIGIAEDRGVVWQDAPVQMSEPCSCPVCQLKTLRADVLRQLEEQGNEVATLAAQQKALRRKNAQLRQDYNDMMNKVLLTAFDPSVAARVGTYAHTAMADVERRIQAAGESRDSQPARAKHLAAFMTERPDIARHLSGQDMNDIVAGYARNEGTQDETLRNQGPGPKSKAQPVPIHLSADEVVAFAEAMPRCDLRDAQAMVDVLGSGARLKRWLDVCKARGLNPVRPDDYETSMRLLFDEAGGDVQRATTVEEAMQSIRRRDDLTFPADRPKAMRVLMSERADLVEVNFRQDEAPRRVELSEADKATKFEEALAAAILNMERFDPYNPRLRALAAKRVAEEHPELIPSYGNRRSR